MIVSGERTNSYAEIQFRIARATAALKSLDLRDGAPVAMLLRNDFALFEISAAAAAIGSPVVPINWHLKSDEIAYILDDCQAEAIIGHADLLAPIRDHLPAGLRVLMVATPPEIAQAYGISPVNTPLSSDTIEWDSWRDSFTPIDAPARRVSPLFYTSGTTGRPKGVRRQNLARDRIAAAERMGSLVYGLLPDDHQVVLMNGPMYHSGPNTYGMQAFRFRCTIVLQARFEPEELLKLIAQYRVTHMHMVPTMFVRLLRLSDAEKSRYDLSSLRCVVHGAAPCPIQIKQAMIQWWGPVINEYYGSTETGIPVWHSSAEALAKPGTVGRVIEGGEVRIYDANGAPCRTNEPGEIFMRQTAIADFSYHGNAPARAQAERDGLISVGDVGYFDADGYLFLCDRKRDMVISGGVNIYPAEIENALIGMDGVSDCAVFGIPDEEFGEQLCAYVEPEVGALLSADSIQDYLRSRLANFKIPRTIRFVDALPREDSGKIFKRKLRAPYWGMTPPS